MLNEFIQQVSDKTSLKEAAKETAAWSKKHISAERCSLFLYDARANRLRTIWADGPIEIEIPFDQGIAGETLRTRRGVLENEPYGDYEFFPDVDMQTGYYTQNILSAPLFNPDNSVFGVIELINKKGGFEKQDLEQLQQIAKVISRQFAPSNMDYHKEDK